MSLENPTIFEKAMQHKKLLIYGALAILLIGLATGLYSCGSDYFFKSKVQKQKDEIANTAKEIGNISNQIANLEHKKIEATANINALAANLDRDLFGREEAKTEANEALANFHKSVNANLDVNRSAEDLERILEKLGNE